MPVPKKADDVNALSRKDQSTIFRIRIQHNALNKHLHRIGAQTTYVCPLCGNPEETIEHHLLYCAPLADLRAQFLPTQLNKENLLYGNPEQLQNTCKYPYMALGRRGMCCKNIHPWQL